VGDAPGQFQNPKGLAVDPDGHLYVADAAFNHFQIFNLDGRILTFVGQVGTRRGQFQVPTGIAITPDGAIYVADQINRRIQKFQYLPEEKEAPASSPNPQ
jgi:DNA-binding beta-propeller fold protein YncE